MCVSGNWSRPVTNSPSDGKSVPNFCGFFCFQPRASFRVSQLRARWWSAIVTYALWKINVATIKITRFCIYTCEMGPVCACLALLKILQRKVMHYRNIATPGCVLCFFIISHYDDKTAIFLTFTTIPVKWLVHARW